MTKKLKEMIHPTVNGGLSKTLVLSLLMMVLSLPSLAQELVKGVVVDAAGDPVIGATVVQKDNRKNATVTDIDGNFSIN